MKTPLPPECVEALGMLTADIEFHDSDGAKEQRAKGRRLAQGSAELERRANAYSRLVEFVHLVALRDAGSLSARLLLRALGEGG